MITYELRDFGNPLHYRYIGGFIMMQLIHIQRYDTETKIIEFDSDIELLKMQRQLVELFVAR